MNQPEPYIALPLQAKCSAINPTTTVEAAPAHRNKVITQLAERINASVSFIKTLAGLEVRLVVLPEYVLTGFPMGQSISEWAALACIEQDGAEYAAMGEICRNLGIFLSGNAYELDPHFPELYFQVSFIIDPTGEVILRYRRLVSMFSPTPHDVLDRFLDIYGDAALFPVVSTSIGMLAAVASEEILIPEISRALTLRGAEIICHSSSEISSLRITPKNTAKRARAYENMAYVVSANTAGVSGTAFPECSADGSSQVVDFHGDVVGHAASGESMAGFAEVDLAALRRARKQPAMSNMLARQRLALFARTYADIDIYPKNNMLRNGRPFSPDREHFEKTQMQVINSLLDKGIIQE